MSGGVSKEDDGGAYFCARQSKKVIKRRRFSSLFFESFVLKDGGGFREARGGLKIPAAVVIFIFIIYRIVFELFIFIGPPRTTGMGMSDWLFDMGPGFSIGLSFPLLFLISFSNIKHIL